MGDFDLYHLKLTDIDLICQSIIVIWFAILI